MKKVLFLGSSHLAAIKYALEFANKNGINHPIDCTLFGSQWESTGLVMVDGIFRGVDAPTTEKLKLMTGVSELDPSMFDYFCLVGVAGAIVTPLSTYRTHRLAGHVGGSTADVISQPCLRQVIRDSFEVGSDARPAVSIIRAIRSVSDKPIFLAPHPVPGAEISTLEKFHWLNEPDAPQAFAFIKRLYQSELERFAAQEGLILLSQSDETYNPEGFTQNRFVLRFKGRKRRPITDCLHMNGEFGTIALKQVVEQIVQ